MVRNFFGQYSQFFQAFDLFGGLFVTSTTIGLKNDTQLKKKRKKQKQSHALKIKIKS